MKLIKIKYKYGIKLQICDIIEYFLDYKQNFLLSNLKDFFKLKTTESQIFEKFSSGRISAEDVESYFKTVIVDHLHEILPDIMKTGTTIDESDPNFKNKNKINKIIEGLNLNNILKFEIFPSLVSLFCLSQNYEIENKILHITSRLYNQRAEFTKLSSNLLLLFDDQNIKIFKQCKMETKKLARNVDESEV